MVAYPDTRVDPRAVVIESFNTVVADGAVFGARGFQNFAVGTHLGRVHVI